jgi:hypothetical protein
VQQVFGKLAGIMQGIFSQRAPAFAAAYELGVFIEEDPSAATA